MWMCIFSLVNGKVYGNIYYQQQFSIVHISLFHFRLCLLPWRLDT
jgi:uncharacterized membrane protein YpjA